MTDFIVYISAQQQTQAVVNDAETRNLSRQDRQRLVAWPGIRTVRQHVSSALYRLAEAIQPNGEPAGALVNAPG